MAQKLIIKGTNKVTLTGNLMTGDTYSIKQWIKQYLCGTWDGELKGYIVDLGQVNQFMSGKYPMIKVDEAAAATSERKNPLGPWCKNGELGEDY